MSPIAHWSGSNFSAPRESSALRDAAGQSAIRAYFVRHRALLSSTQTVAQAPPLAATVVARTHNLHTELAVRGGARAWLRERQRRVRLAPSPGYFQTRHQKRCDARSKAPLIFPRPTQ